MKFIEVTDSEGQFWLLNTKHIKDIYENPSGKCTIHGAYGSYLTPVETYIEVKKLVRG